MRGSSEGRGGEGRSRGRKGAGGNKRERGEEGGSRENQLVRIQEERVQDRGVWRQATEC